MNLPVIVLAGGLGTRLLAVTGDLCPKPMVRIPFAESDYPFLEFVLGHLRTMGLTRIIVCIGHLGEQIRDHFGDGHRFGLNIGYDDAGSALTATRAMRASQLLQAQEMFVVCGDVYHRLDMQRFMLHFRQHPKWLIQLAVRPSVDSMKANVSLADDGRVLDYARADIEGSRLGLETGVLAVRRRTFEGMSASSDLSFTDDVYPQLIRSRTLGAFESDAPYFDIGSPEAYQEFCAFAHAGGAVPISRMP